MGEFTIGTEYIDLVGTGQKATTSSQTAICAAPAHSGSASRSRTAC